jgi:hypothetical protein
MGLIRLFKKRDKQPELHLQLLVVSNNWGADQPRPFALKKQWQEEKGARSF